MSFTFQWIRRYHEAHCLHLLSFTLKEWWQGKSYLMVLLCWWTHRWSPKHVKFPLYFRFLHAVQPIWCLEGWEAKRGAPGLAAPLPLCAVLWPGPSFPFACSHSLEAFLCLSLSVFLALRLLQRLVFSCKCRLSNSLILHFLLLEWSLVLRWRWGRRSSSCLDSCGYLRNVQASLTMESS